MGPPPMDIGALAEKTKDERTKAEKNPEWQGSQQQPWYCQGYSHYSQRQPEDESQDINALKGNSKGKGKKGT